MAQLWVNLPAAKKMTPPKYQPIVSESIPKLTIPGGAVRVIAGDFQGIAGAATTHTSLNLWDITLDGTMELVIPESHKTAMLLSRDGTIGVQGHAVGPQSLAILSGDGTKLVLESQGAAKALVLTGEPINEPIAHYGPFCMNTQEELEQALRDYRSGKFGT